MRALRPAIRVPARSLALLLASAGLLAAACGGGVAPVDDAEPAPARAADADASALPASGVGASPYDFPTGPAVAVAAGYTHPEDHVPSTGAYLPVNGQPTVVFVDAIW